MQKIRLAGVGNVPNLRRLLLIDADVVIGVFTPRLRTPSIPLTPLAPQVGGTLSASQQVVAGDGPLAIDASLSELGEVSYDIYFVPGDGVFVEGFDSAQPDIRRTNISINVPGDYAAIADVEYKMKNRRWIGITEDNNGLVRLVGTENQPLSFTSEYSSENRGRTFVFSALTYQAAYYLLGDIEAISNSLGGDGGFNHGFSNGYNI